MSSIQHVENMRVAQAGIYESPPDVRWYIVTANGYIVRGPYLDREQAQEALEQWRRWVRAEIADEENERGSAA